MDRLNSAADNFAKNIESIGSKSPVEGAATRPQAATGPATQPMTVALVAPRASNLAAFQYMMRGVVGPITSFGIVMILGLFMLIRQEDVRDRALRLLGGGQLHVATQALDDAGARVSRYLLIQFIINASFGACIAAGLYFIGVPYSLLWGVLAAALRFVPYFGAPIAAVAPVAMAFVATSGWTAVILTIVLFAVLEFSIANLVEPWLYGSSARISPLAILASAVFWSWLWGPIGLLLSTPLTVCLVVIGRHVPRLRYLSVVLGDEPALAPEARFYQRLLAGDQTEAWDIAERTLRDSSPTALYDTVIIPGLILAEEDRNREELDAAREKYIFQSIRDLLEDLGGRPLTAPAPPVEAGDKAATERVAIGVEPGDAARQALEEQPAGKKLKVLCLPANDEADEMGAIMLSHLLTLRGIKAEALSFSTLAGERLEVVGEKDVGLVCVSAVPPEGLRHARYLCKRLRARYPGLKIVAGLWRETGDLGGKLPVGLVDEVVTSLASAVERILALANLEAFRTDGGAASHRSAAAGTGAGAE